jgi:WS/DGAT/MGAT family acyltransferase
MFFAIPPSVRSAAEVPAPDFSSLLALLRQEVGSMKYMGEALRDLGAAALGRGGDLTPPLQAPLSILNGRVSRNRRFATQRYPLDRLKSLARAAGGTLNDVVIALCAGGLRRFLSELGQLPDRPLVAFLPVNIRPKGDAEGGNAIGAVLTSMATDLADPRARIEAIIASTQRAKEQLQGLTQSAIMTYSALLMAPFGLQSFQALTGMKGRMPVNFNVCISNVPGPEKPLYFRGAQLEAVYPVSIPTHGMALNITCESYAGSLCFGFVGCRDTLPHLQRLAVYTGEALDELEKALAPAMSRSAAS